MNQNNYKEQYEKYKSYYLEQKNDLCGGTRKNEEKKLNLPLFFDLLQVSKQILKLTSENDILILVGDSPSYLKPFLEKERTVFNLAFSNKPYGCFLSPLGNPYNPPPDLRKKYIMPHPNSYMPDPEDEENYFEYLDKETILTKELVTSKWYNIVLIDISAGQSIYGVSIFLNRYIGNIKRTNDCIDINGAKPLKFIKLSGSKYGNTNIDIELAVGIDHYINFPYYNYNPKLIILFGVVIFLYGDDFLFGRYDRYVPIYTIQMWNRSLYDGHSSLDKGLKNIKLLSKLNKYYHDYKNNKSIVRKLVGIIKHFDNDDNYSPMIKKIIENDRDVTNKLDKLFDKINKDILYKKYDNPSQDQDNGHDN